MIINNLNDIITQNGFYWTGTGYYTCGFYRIRKNMGSYYLEKFLGYRYHRVVYDNVCQLYTTDVYNSWFDVDVNESDLNNFIKNLKNATRDTKLKRLSGYFKHSESHYSMLHCNN